MAFEEKTIEKETVLTTPIFTLTKHKVEAAGGTATRYIIEHRGAVAIAALTKENRLLMVRQYRKAVEQVVWEIPAGKIDKDEEPELFEGQSLFDAWWLKTAKRELKEETGWEAVNWRPLCSVCGSVGYCSERIEVWRADCTNRGNTDFDEDEDLDLYEMEIPVLVEMIKKGEIFDAKTICAVMMIAEEQAKEGA